MEIDVEGDEEAERLLEEMQQRMANLTPVLRVIGQDVVSLVTDSFDQSKTPMGVPWLPLKGPRRHKRDRGEPKPLIDTGVLRRSITARASTRELEVGTSVPYAGTHQFGTTTIPARPFLPVNAAGQWDGPEAELDAYAEMIGTYIETGRITG